MNNKKPPIHSLRDCSEGREAFFRGTTLICSLFRKREPCQVQDL